MPQRPSPRAKILRALLPPALCLLAACAGANSNNSNAVTGVKLPPEVATVNGQPVSTKLYEMYLKNGREEFGLDPSTEEGRRKLDLLREGIASELIDRAVIAQEAERRGLVIAPDKLAEAERKAIAQLGGEQKYDEYLASHNLTRGEYREVIMAEVYGELLRAELSKDLKVSDEEVAKYYGEHKSDAAFQIPERVAASHVLVAARPNLVAQEIQREQSLAGEALAAAVREEMSRRRERAEDIRRRAAGRADFSALAREFSEDPATRGRGGDLGTFARDSHARAFDDAAFKLKAGEVSEVVETDFGYHVIKLRSREPARAQTLTEAAPEIRRRLLAAREAENLKDWLKEMRNKADVRIEETFRIGALRDEFPPAEEKE